MTLKEFLEQEPRKLHFYGPELVWMRTAKEIIRKQAATIEQVREFGGEHNGMWCGLQAKKCQREIEEILK